MTVKVTPENSRKTALQFNLASPAKYLSVLYVLPMVIPTFIHCSGVRQRVVVIS